MIHTDLIRSRAPGDPGPVTFPHVVTRVIDDERRQQFGDEGAHFESDHYLALTYLPPLESEEKVKGWMFEGRTNKDSGVGQAVLDRFKSRVEMFENVFSFCFESSALGALILMMTSALLNIGMDYSAICGAVSPATITFLHCRKSPLT